VESSLTAVQLAAAGLAAVGGGLAALAIREAVAAAPGAGRWLARSLEPLRRAGEEGYAPSEHERGRLAVIGALVMLAAGVLVLGPGPSAPLAAAGPAAAAWVIARRRAAYCRGVDRGLPEVAVAVADALASGRSPRAALAAAAASLEGPPAIEMQRVRAEIALGAPTREVLERLRRRVGSSRVDSFAAALLSQQLAGGELATLLRRFAAAARERDRTDADARSATAQARFTGLLVVAMPVGAALLAELLEPGFVAGLLAEPASAVLLLAAAGLQLAGFAAIRRLSRIAVR
jgi:tight adherence protein B